MAQPFLPYELTCLGQLPSNDPELLEALQNRLQQHFQLVDTFEHQEYLFLKDDPTRLDQTSGFRDDEILRLRRLLQGSQSSPHRKQDTAVSWHLESLHAPVRDQAGALCRAYTSVDLPGASQAEAQRFISALGFKPKSDVVRKGLEYSRGSTKVSIFQVYHADHPERPLLPQVYLVEAVNRIAVPAPLPKGQAAAAGADNKPQPQPAQVMAAGLSVMQDIKALLKGLVALQRVEPAF